MKRVEQYSVPEYLPNKKFGFNTCPKPNIRRKAQLFANHRSPSKACFPLNSIGRVASRAHLSTPTHRSLPSIVCHLKQEYPVIYANCGRVGKEQCEEVIAFERIQWRTENYVLGIRVLAPGKLYEFPNFSVISRSRPGSSTRHPLCQEYGKEVGRRTDRRLAFL
ncbi:hypothetical protein BC936DRAFT_146199 [Jimgerdemannia flammicorona]|uniref:Uncharacterized protein n=1 Tax=Jimgerdemannia flammicorona TaxID=994334 RepID=A0A433D837_9FUNG|nr:hypothetical protein BC936DRAFT_146199 [Jimgerdemannia flammicorona]